MVNDSRNSSGGYYSAEGICAFVCRCGGGLQRYYGDSIPYVEGRAGLWTIVADLCTLIWRKMHSLC